MTTVPHDNLESTLALVTRARQGDREALEVIAERYQLPLRRFAHGRLPAGARGLVDTEDVVQVAVVRTLSRLDRFQPAATGSLLAYLRRAVLNQIRDEIRNAHRRPGGPSVSLQVPDRGLDPLEEAISRESLERYEEALATLPSEQQEAFMMRIEMGCAYRDIADAIGKPSANAARLLVRRAIQGLVHALRRPPAR